MLRLFRVSGHSMAPSYLDGDLLLVLRWPLDWMRPGRTVILRVKGIGFVVKRLEAILGDDRVWVSSDNGHTQSTVCQQTHSSDAIVGTVIARVAGRRRAGLHTAQPTQHRP